MHACAGLCRSASLLPLLRHDSPLTNSLARVCNPVTRLSRGRRSGIVARDARERSDMAARLKHFGWGREGEGLDADERDFLLARVRERFGVDRFEERSPPPLDA